VTREEVQRRISEQRVELAEMGVRSLEIFGSVARGEAAAASDLDLLVGVRPGDRPVPLLPVQRRLEQILGCPSTWSCATP
jgi:uncharacterized protein